MPSKEDTYIIFDWDDTLFPTTYLFSSQPGSLSENFQMPTELQATLDAVAASVLETLELAKQFGQVEIITNSETGWIELSTRRFFPSLVEAIDGIPKISARSGFESQENPLPVQWKTHAFANCINNFYGSSRNRNVISVGDSEHDRAALFLAAQNASCSWAKSLKLSERPDVEYILKEQELIRESMEQLAQHQGALDLCIHCEPHEQVPLGEQTQNAL
jgi:hypothetical protein